MGCDPQFFGLAETVQQSRVLSAPSTGSATPFTLDEAQTVADCVVGFLVTIRAIGGDVYLDYYGGAAADVAARAPFIIQEGTALSLLFDRGAASTAPLFALAALAAGRTAAIGVKASRRPGWADQNRA